MNNFTQAPDWIDFGLSPISNEKLERDCKKIETQAEYEQKYVPSFKLLEDDGEDEDEDDKERKITRPIKMLKCFYHLLL